RTRIGFRDFVRREDAREANMHRRQDPAKRRQQMRHEYERSSVAEPETLADLRLVPMLSHPVRLEIAVQFCEGPRKVGFFSRAGDAALRVTDHRLFAIDGVS